MRIKEGDYINGYKVERVLNNSKPKRYLVTYFCPMYQKPQSKQLTDDDVVTYMSKGDFNKMCKKSGGIDGKNR